MSDAEKTVFISYRRSVSAFIARAIFMDLRAHGYDVFMDVESIDSGQFDTIILNQIAARAHFLIVLTPGSVERCKEPGDWLRREIEYAMELQRNIVPILANNFSFGGTEPYLTGSLSELSRYNGLPLYHDYFDEAMQRLRGRFLKQPFYGAIRPAPRADQPVVQRKIEEAARTPEESLTAEQYFERGNQAFEHEDYQDAINNYTEAIRLNPQSIRSYNYRGLARKKLGDLNGAISDFGEAISLNPQVGEAYYNRGAVYEQQGEYQKALTDYAAALRFGRNYEWGEWAKKNHANLLKKMKK
jgi:tetratricopeptide (TPR) repeat protein